MDKKKLLSIVGRFKGVKIAVWGDFILDEHLYGTTRRISREAPVLILNYQDQEFSLGGAGNSLQNLKALGAEPIPIGVIGRDEAGKRILNLLKSKNIRTEHLFQERDFRTPLKTRILAGEDNTRKQQILRIDREGKVPDDPALKQWIREALLHSFGECAALLISDYNYDTVKEDVFREIASVTRRSHLPVAIDSRFRLLTFEGATIATPNEPEVESALGIEISGKEQALRQAAGRIQRKLRSPALLVTRGSKGMILFEKDKAPFSIPVFGTTDIVDVTGAGDTVTSVMTLAIASGASFREAAVLANFAGGIVVMKKGAATLSLQELKQAILS